MTTTTLAGTVATQANVYFDGKCVSHTVTLPMAFASPWV